MPKPRPKADKKVKPILRIWCEGEKTEPNYINGYLGRYYNSNKLIVVEPNNKTTPKQLVKLAVEATKADNALKNDAYWVVYDRESVSKYPDHFHAEAARSASKANVKIAFSNVCFEMWLLLHFTDSTASYTSCDNLLRESQFKEAVRSLGIPDYQKSCPHLFPNLSNERIQAARRRAAIMNRNTLRAAPQGVTAPHLLNPYTNVHELLDAIDEWIRANNA